MGQHCTFTPAATLPLVAGEGDVAHQCTALHTLSGAPSNGATPPDPNNWIKDAAKVCNWSELHKLVNDHMMEEEKALLSSTCKNLMALPTRSLTPTSRPVPLVWLHLALPHNPRSHPKSSVQYGKDSQRQMVCMNHVPILMDPSVLLPGYACWYKCIPAALNCHVFGHSLQSVSIEATTLLLVMLTMPTNSPNHLHLTASWKLMMLSTIGISASLVRG